MDDGKIIDMFFARNEDAIRHTDAAYGRRLSSGKTDRGKTVRTRRKASAYLLKA